MGGNGLLQARTDPGSTLLVHGEWAAVHPALAPAKLLPAVGSTIEHLVVEFHAALPQIVDVFIHNGGNFRGLTIAVDIYIKEVEGMNEGAI